MNRVFRLILIGGAAAAALAGCASSARYVDPAKIRGVSEKFGFKDTDRVVKRMVASMREQYLSDQPKQTIIVGRIRNKTLEHINTSEIRGQMRGALMKQGVVIVDKENRDKIIAEHKHNLSGMVDEKTSPKIGAMIAAKLLLLGEISSEKRKQGIGDTIIIYQLTLRLTSIETGTVVWSRSHRLAKAISSRKIVW